MMRVPDVRLAISEDDILRCHPVLLQLRPHVPLDGFVARVRRMMDEGYLLAYLTHAGTVSAVVGFRIMEQFHAGRVLYVDDLVTDVAMRSTGQGATLLRWLKEYGRQDQCDFLDLASGVDRVDAHRFYQREGFRILGHHYRFDL